VSALEGDNVVDRSDRTPWYDGPALLELLETLPAAAFSPDAPEPLRLPVQLVLRPQGGLAPDVAADPVESERLRDYRAVAGRISSGSVRVGDRVQLFPSGIATTVTGIRSSGTPVEEAVASQSVSLEFADDLDTARGALVVAEGTLPAGRREVDVELFQLDARPTTPGARVLVKHGTTTVQAIVAQIESRYDLDALVHEPAQTLQTNDIGRARLRLAADLPLEPYSASRHGGSFLVIHPSDGATLAAGIVRD
jgi:sulfate adenylyltransferase subunit 1